MDRVCTVLSVLWLIHDVCTDGLPTLEVPWSGIVGEDATLTCKYPGFDASEGYGWEINKRPILEENEKYQMTFNESSFSLTIKNLKPADEGTFRCSYNFLPSSMEDFRVESKAKREHIHISSSNQYLNVSVNKLYPEPSLAVKYQNETTIAGNRLRTTTDGDGLYQLDWVSLEKLPVGPHSLTVTITTRLTVKIPIEHKIKGSTPSPAGATSGQPVKCQHSSTIYILLMLSVFNLWF